MKAVKKIIDTVSVSAIFLMLTAHSALEAADMKAPSWVNRVDKDDLSDAGEEINLWIFVFMAVIIALFSVKPGYYFIVGKTDEAVEASKNILIGAVLSVILGGIVFTVVNVFN